MRAILEHGSPAVSCAWSASTVPRYETLIVNCISHGVVGGVDPTLEPWTRQRTLRTTIDSVSGFTYGRFIC